MRIEAVRLIGRPRGFDIGVLIHVDTHGQRRMECLRVHRIVYARDNCGTWENCKSTSCAPALFGYIEEAGAGFTIRDD